MPHVVLNGNVSIKEIFEKIDGLLIRNEGEILKTDTVYINRDKTAILIESLAIETGNKHNFLTMISHRDDGMVVRIYPNLEVEKTNGVKKILAEIAKQIVTMSTQLTIGETNLSDYLN
jgi:hypothetical protein